MKTTEEIAREIVENLAMIEGQQRRSEWDAETLRVATIFEGLIAQAITQERERSEILKKALEKLQSRHLSCHTMDFRVCDICELYLKALKEIGE